MDCLDAGICYDASLYFLEFSRKDNHYRLLKHLSRALSLAHAAPLILDLGTHAGSPTPPALAFSLRAGVRACFVSGLLCADCSVLRLGCSSTICLYETAVSSAACLSCVAHE